MSIAIVSEEDSVKSESVNLLASSKPKIELHGSKITRKLSKNTTMEIFNLLSEEEGFRYKEAFSLFALTANNIAYHWMLLLVVFVNSGDTPFDSLEIDLGLTETQYGLLSGVTFYLISSVFTVLSGIIVDKVSRKVVLIVAAIFWSGLTIAQSFSTSFINIMIPRIGMEMAMSACNPTALSLVSDYYNKKSRARASSIYQ